MVRSFVWVRSCVRAADGVGYFVSSGDVKVEYGQVDGFSFVCVVVFAYECVPSLCVDR